jgi:hypothetical protein
LGSVQHGKAMSCNISDLDLVRKDQIPSDAQVSCPWSFNKECCVALHSKPHGRHNFPTHVSVW